MNLTRCAWVPPDNQLYINYHDKEWGVPVHDDRTFFEFLILEGAQAGLSWSTILNKRKGYRQAFANFDPAKVAKFTKAKQAKLHNFDGIVKNRLKIASAITNANSFLAVQQEFGSFDQYLWGFVDGQPIINHWQTIQQVPAVTPLAEEISQDLKKRGFKFVGPTIIYAYMQAVGLVNDHTTDCFRYRQLQ